MAIQQIDQENIVLLTNNTRRLQQEVNRIAGQTSYSREEKPEDKIQPSHHLKSVQNLHSAHARLNIWLF